MKSRLKIAITGIALGLLIVAQLKLLDDVGVHHTEQGLSRALVTFGIARGLNGVISVVQGTEVAIEPVGVGMTFTPGQILDPVNDLIEQFSTIVLVSGTAFGMQRVFLDIVGAPAFVICTALVTLLALAMLWFGGGVPAAIKHLLYRTALILLIIRFSVPLVAIFSENFYQYFLAPQYQSSSQQLLSTTDQLQDIHQRTHSGLPDQATTGSTDKSFLDSARELYRSATGAFDVRQHLQDFKTAAENISENAIKLIVVFVLQTIILPLASLWLLLKAIGWVAMRKPLSFGAD